MNQIVFLIGYMGVGKTTVGKKLSNHLGVNFIDTDKVIEKKFNCSISEFFKKYGEDTFRQEERKVVQEIIHKEVPIIVSVGGGLPCFLENMELMNSGGVTIYLHRPVKELFQRLKQGKSSRPLIANMSDDELLLFIEKSLAEREEYYSQADIIASRDCQESQYLAKLIGKI